MTFSWRGWVICTVGGGLDFGGFDGDCVDSVVATAANGANGETVATRADAAGESDVLVLLA